MPDDKTKLPDASGMLYHVRPRYEDDEGYSITKTQYWIVTVAQKFGVPTAIVFVLLFSFGLPIRDSHISFLERQIEATEKIAVITSEMNRTIVELRRTTDEQSRMFSERYVILEAIRQLLEEQKKPIRSGSGSGGTPGTVPPTRPLDMGIFEKIESCLLSLGN